MGVAREPTCADRYCIGGNQVVVDRRSLRLATLGFLAALLAIVAAFTVFRDLLADAAILPESHFTAHVAPASTPSPASGETAAMAAPSPPARFVQPIGTPRELPPAAQLPPGPANPKLADQLDRLERVAVGLARRGIAPGPNLHTPCPRT